MTKTHIRRETKQIQRSTHIAEHTLFQFKAVCRFYPVTRLLPNICMNQAVVRLCVLLHVLCAITEIKFPKSNRDSNPKKQHHDLKLTTTCVISYIRFVEQTSAILHSFKRQSYNIWYICMTLPKNIGHPIQETIRTADADITN